MVMTPAGSTSYGGTGSRPIETYGRTACPSAGNLTRVVGEVAEFAESHWGVLEAWSVRALGFDSHSDEHVARERRCHTCIRTRAGACC